MKRYGRVVGIKESDIKKYKAAHADVCPEVLEEIKKANIQNYSIYLHQLDNGMWYLFSHFEYTGNDLMSDMAGMGDNPKMKEIWQLCRPYFTPLENREDKSIPWSMMEEVFYLQ